MGEMTKTEICNRLKALNGERTRASDIAIYADAFIEYRLAQANIDQHGTIVFHPKTGAPIENPYISIRNKASQVIQRFTMLKTGDLWGL